MLSDLKYSVSGTPDAEAKRLHEIPPIKVGEAFKIYFREEARVSEEWGAFCMQGNEQKTLKTVRSRREN